MFSQTRPVRPSRGPFIIVSAVDSTNNYAMAKLHADLVQPGTCVLAVEQTAGKGQRGRQWQASPGQNITLSIAVPAFHYPAYPFLESATIALSCCRFIQQLGLDHVFVKWPNDVYVNDRKAAGILIEKQYRGRAWRASVAGIGMNVNQTRFPDELAKAISLKQALGHDLPVVGLSRALHQEILSSLEEAKHISPEDIMKNYHSSLYQLGSEVKLKKGSRRFTATVKGVSMEGRLLVSDPFDQQFDIGEVEFV